MLRCLTSNRPGLGKKLFADSVMMMFTLKHEGVLQPWEPPLRGGTHTHAYASREPRHATTKAKLTPTAPCSSGGTNTVAPLSLVHGCCLQRFGP